MLAPLQLHEVDRNTLTGKLLAVPRRDAEQLVLTALRITPARTEEPEDPVPLVADQPVRLQRRLRVLLALEQHDASVRGGHLHQPCPLPRPRDDQPCPARSLDLPEVQQVMMLVLGPGIAVLVERVAAGDPDDVGAAAVAAHSVFTSSRMFGDQGAEGDQAAGPETLAARSCSVSHAIT